MTPPRTASPKLALLAACACLALGACKKEESPSQQAAAGAKILPRSVGDDMLPYDTVRSQSPLAAPEAATRGSSAPRAAASEAAAPEDSAADAAAAAAADVEAAAAGPVR